MAVAVHGDARERARLASGGRMLIDGQWVDAASGATFPSIDPATENVLTEVAHGQAEDIDRAVRAARRAFEDGSPWRRMRPAERGRLVHRIGDLILENADDLATLESLDNGKPRVIARMGDIPLSADTFHYMAGWATKLDGRTVPISALGAPDEEFLAYTQREPVGVVGQIVPWNFPLLMAAWKLAPALTTGCTVVLKPAEQTPLTALRLGELLLEAGLPDGVVNIVPGFGDAGAHLAAHPDVDKVAFTGSTEVGRLIIQASAGNLKKVSLELGGKSPQVILKDADLETAVKGAASAIFFNHGQVCCAGSRLYVESDVFDDVTAGVAEEARRIKLGPGMQEDTDMGPLVSAEQLERVTGYLQSGAEEGARALSGGRRAGDRGYFVEPTVLVDTHPNMRVVREEIFGPVLCAIPFTDRDDVLASANDTNYGLAAGVWTNDLSQAHRVGKALRAGTVWVNCWNVFDSAMPFGGYKESGWGRECAGDVLDNYLETKAVYVHL